MYKYDTLMLSWNKNKHVEQKLLLYLYTEKGFIDPYEDDKYTYIRYPTLCLLHSSKDISLASGGSFSFFRAEWAYIASTPGAM